MILRKVTIKVIYDKQCYTLVLEIQYLEIQCYNYYILARAAILMRNVLCYITCYTQLYFIRSSLARYVKQIHQPLYVLASTRPTPQPPQLAVIPTSSTRISLAV